MCCTEALQTRALFWCDFREYDDYRALGFFSKLILFIVKIFRNVYIFSSYLGLNDGVASLLHQCK